MCLALAWKDIRFCNAEEQARIAKEFLENQGRNLSDDAKVGFCLEVTLRYPKEMQKRFSDYPPLAQKRVVSPDEYSPFTKQLIKRHKLKPSATPKLVSDLREKQHYKIHYSNLKYVLSLGVELVAVHRVVRFQQKPWLKPYIDHNNRRRGECSSASEKDFYKLKNNSCFGKLFEDPRKYQSIVLVRDANLFRRRVARIDFHSCMILNEDTALVMMEKTVVHMRKPNYLGSIILDRSKDIMMRFWYDNLLPTFQRPGSTASLCTTDTDSFVVGITYTDPRRSFYSDLASLAPCLDTSNYSDQHPYFVKNMDQFDHLKLMQRKNKGVLGKMKDESGGDRFAIEGVFLKSKLYSILFDDGQRKQACKGISKGVVHREINIDHYRRVVETLEPQRNKMRVLRSKQHQLYMLEIDKCSLSLFDDKRYAVDRVHTLPFGHALASVE